MVKYISKFVIAVVVPDKSAELVAQLLVDQVVFRFGPFRELIAGNAAELTGSVVDHVVLLLQAKQSTPVPYRPAMLGLVEQYNQIWKDIVALHVVEQQKDWYMWLPAVTCAYNSAQHTTTGFAPHALMSGR